MQIVRYIFACVPFCLFVVLLTFHEIDSICKVVTKCDEIFRNHLKTNSDVTLFHQANTNPPKLNRDEAKGRDALLTDICKGARLKKVAVVNDRSAPVIEKPKGGGGGSAGGSGAGPGAGKSMGGLFQGGVPKLRPVGALQPPGSKPSAPRPNVSGTSSGSGRQADSETASLRASPPEPPRSHRPSLPDISRPPSTSSNSGGMKHSSSAPPPPPPVNRRGNAPPAPQQKATATSYNREKPLPPTPGHRAPPVSGRDAAPPPPVKPPPSPHNSSRPTSGVGSTSLAPPPPPYRQPPGVPNGPSSPSNEAAPELPQRHNSLHKKIPSSTQPRAQAPPPPPSPSIQSSRPPPPAREPPGRGAAPPVPPPVMRNGGRDAPPPPPPYRMHGTAAPTSTEPLTRGKPPPPPSRTPAGPPPPPPPIRNGHTSISKSFIDDFESKYSFHSMEEFPPPEEYRHFAKIYPSKTNRVMRGAPPLPPVGR
ncbi:WAS/WASL-interacting protein family member 2 isoform X2 [Paramormyrops kingsleyae]|uniref:WAS/WASL-interacting protein family member 2 isoform X2 n=1 Tax=Paramormyrops kingsleyae TaxID=1676925 RepID=UPI003B96C00D